MLTRYRWRLLAGLACALVVLILAVVVTGFWRARLVAPEATVLLRDRHGQFLGEVGGTDETGYGYWPLAELPPRVVAATVVVEDRRFEDHPGVDPKAVLRAIWQNLSNRKRVSGASTIAMQVARMQSPGSRTYLRKATEAVTALLLTQRYGRQQVLRHYLRIVPYGNQVHGIAYAARRYLDKPVADLSWAEIALLAAIPQAPARMNPFNPAGRRRAVERGTRILDLLYEAGHLSRIEHELAAEQIGNLQVPPRNRRPDEAMHAVLAMAETLSRPEHRQAIAGQQIVTTGIDLALQRELSWIVLERLIGWDRQGAGNAALIVADLESHEIVAWVGSGDYFDEHHAGAIDYARVPRSPGSTLKPFLYAQALEQGVITPATILDDLQRGAGGIGNADGRFLGPLLPRVALANSRNVPAANLLAAIGLDQGYTFLADLGLHDGVVPADRYGLGLAVGGMPVTLEQLVRAYTVLAGDGRLTNLVWYRRQPQQPPRRIITEATARQVTRFLADPMARLPSFPRMGWLEFPFPVAVKTGTSSNYHDAWTVAYSRRYLVGAWVGHPDFRPMARLSGYRATSRLVREVLLHLQDGDSDGLENTGFPPPRGYVPVKLCALTGRRATPITDQVFVEHFYPGQEPIEASQAHLRLPIDIRNGLLATPQTPVDQVEVRTFIDLGPRYADWQVAQGLPHPPRLTSLLGDTPGAATWTMAQGPVRAIAQVTEPGISITEPEPDLQILRDPETPAGRATIALRATVDPPTEQVVWYVDGEPFQVTDYPYTARWQLQPGEHTFQARLPFRESASSVVRVTVY
jgi:penicillin-binding protein 1C